MKLQADTAFKSFVFLLVLVTPILAGSAVASRSSLKVAKAETQKVANVKMKNDKFSPSVITVKVNTTVTWTNKDLWGHTVTADNGLFSSGKLTSGDHWTFTFTKAGEYPYHCDIHKHMTGKVVVQ
jgi:plastocyanin